MIRTVIRRHPNLPMLLVILIVAIGAKVFVARNGYIIGVVLGNSCYPKLKHLDLVVYQKPSSLSDIYLGDHLLFSRQNRNIVKEVVALPGDRVCLKNVRVRSQKEIETRLFVNRQLVSNPYVYTWPVCDGDSSLQIGQETTLGQQQYFLMPTNKVGCEKCVYVVSFGIIGGKVIRHYTIIPERLVLGFRRVISHEAKAYQQETLRTSD